MTMLSLGEAARLIQGATVHGDASVTFERVSTDSRTVGPGDLFVALKGERFDAHDFLADVAARGAAAALVSHTPAGLAMPTIEGGETRAALGALAHGWRKRFPLPVVAVTGSNGKTTVKEMIASIFAAAVGADARLATAGNLNNDVGLPLTLLRLNAAHRLAVIELGMNHPGETEILARLTAPTVALVNNAQREHQEFMATVEAVALEHAAVIHALAPDGVAVFPADDAYAGIWRVAATGNRIVDFALDDGERHTDAQVTGRVDGGALAIDTPAGSITVRLRALGAHNARNALAATAAALAAGVALTAIRQGLEAFEPVKGRLQVRQASAGSLAGATVVDDTYNANPDSMRAAIDVLAAQPAPRVLVIGDMGEVGDEGPAFHREVGAYARERGIDALFALGDASRDACASYGDTARHFGDVGALVDALLAAGYGVRATVLVKGSRYMKMERVVDALTNQPAAGTTPAAP
ncbi:UDP-N-acetylmuramoyl-tripeptide--D-alanyl-D-alanine ligase [Burkholderia ubonensis]|uniref:UDP-N-acetylmuramoyl-tripeptide--D-alanyl-D- alanine ligase n=1 Tax=Burkholderia ubonensis TaxID=101571 RepID=UPI00075EAA4A|nr:UDP-N-acetylmuramoyl-tripeptide--D-alanyl-D-alanine ligase [Burkholderia ubonensis]KWK96341.1 UDP-N-acetylmuramoyl-tripeptide--D-alanyl-D-alanine ligase [Burkholderia ubonensis]KWN01529.1 UDP-N-acetylmuramoyl-tripeptide--D-alanyl-D-alanine ligase [Burkholderia ubonensis]KWN27869.1 UDP-N-acetylmuramoyl-tripeptide--D-alanyl-D-alanine ligase [Burkholderia ubonensis]KWN67403.1 UDP-N-acetylmuramoyl-tripeptide--D-alanyl-D-alanine ligase [Burkholderia ubonensis]ODQ28942.1 UDP-N-acetylmuramoyl-trip